MTLVGPKMNANPLKLAEYVYENPALYRPDSDIAILAAEVLKLHRQQSYQDANYAALVEAAIGYVNGEVAFEVLQFAAKRFLEPV